MTIYSLPSSEQTTAEDPTVDTEQLIALSDSEELLAKLDNEALLAKFLDVNANFIAVGPLARQFQEPRYSQLRDELYRIDLEIRRRALLGTPEHKAAVKAAHDQAWQVHIARPRARPWPSLGPCPVGATPQFPERPCSGEPPIGDWTLPAVYILVIVTLRTRGISRNA